MNNKPIYIYTRFSIPFINKPWSNQIDRLYNFKNQTTNDKYLSFLFNSNRLNNKFFMFENITVPTIVSQKYENFLWIIFISSLLPNLYKDRLKTILSKYDQTTNLIELNGFINTVDLINSHTPQDKEYISIRIDDDDGLPQNYFTIVNDQIKNYDIIGMNNRLLLSKDNQEVIHYTKEKTNHLLSCGLSCQNSHILSMGNHMKAHEKYTSLFLDQTCLMSCGDFTLTKRHEQFTNQIFNLDTYYS